jgi:hypothetical protein
VLLLGQGWKASNLAAAYISNLKDSASAASVAQWFQATAQQIM